MRRIFDCIALCTAMAIGVACYTSPSPKNDPNGLSPLGVRGQIKVGDDRYEGELLALTTTDFVMLTVNRVVIIPYNVAGTGNFGSISVGTYGAPWETHAQQLRYASRFPYGIPQPAMAAILKSKGQTAPDTAKLSGR